jgi:HTH-type transcriptional regulator/antitoxin MqsA
MNDSLLCPQCEKGHLLPSKWADDFQHNGKTVRVVDLECYICDRCGADPVFTDQIRRNQLKISDAKRKLDGLLTGDEVRSVREHLGLSQQQSAVLFGGGVNAFSKYERGDVMQSVAMDRLLKVTAFFPGVLGFLEFEAGLLDVSSGRLEVSAYQAAATCNMADKSFSSRSVRGALVNVEFMDWTTAEAA